MKLNKSYHLKMTTVLFDKLKERANEEGIDLSLLIRDFLWKGLKKTN